MSDQDQRRKFLDRIFEESPLDRIAAGAPLPTAEIPSFYGLSVTPGETPKLTEETLKEQLAELLYRVSPRVYRSIGSEIEEDDEIVVDLSGYCQGQLLPFTTHSSLTLGPGHDDIFPDLRLELEGAAVGAVEVVELEVPESYPVEKFRNRPAFFSVRIISAAEVALFDVESPEFFNAVQAGRSLQEVVDELGRQWIEEQTFRARAKAFSDLMGTLAERANLQIPASVIDQEIGRSWRRVEGELLDRMQTPPEQQSMALSGWLELPELRAEAERRLKSSAMLRAIMLGNKDFFSAPALRDLMDRIIVDSGSEPATVRAEFKRTADEAINHRMMEALLYLRAIEFVMTQVAKLSIDPQ